MLARDIVKSVVQALNDHDIPYMLVGSFSTNFYGTERSTKDADLVLQLGDKNVNQIFKALGGDFHCDPQSSFETKTFTTRYVIAHVASAFKVELFLLSSDAHDTERFSRRRQVDYLGANIWIPTAEDTVITKLRWARPKDELDVAAVLAVQRGHVDLQYIRKWCDEHGSRARLDAILSQVETSLA